MTRSPDQEDSMSETIGRLNRTIAAQGPDVLLVEARDALALAYSKISDLHAHRRELTAIGTPSADTDVPAAREVLASALFWWYTDDELTADRIGRWPEHVLPSEREEALAGADLVLTHLLAALGHSDRSPA